jgi:hypothetical protein
MAEECLRVGAADVKLQVSFASRTRWGEEKVQTIWVTGDDDQAQLFLLFCCLLLPSIGVTVQISFVLIDDY